jgi:uncharacterized membrane protein YidH (DUF202 family)
MWLSARHQEMLERICAGPAICRAEQLRDRLCGERGNGWDALVDSVRAVKRLAADVSVMERTFAMLQMARRLRVFVRVAGTRFHEAHETLRSQCAMPGSAENHKRLRKEALRCALTAEAVQATAQCCVELCGAGESRATMAALALECDAWRQAEESASAMRVALYEMRQGGPIDAQLRRRPELVPECRSFSSSFADDVFLVPGHEVAALLVRLGGFVCEAASYEMTSVTLDTLPELEDYQQVCSGSGVSVTRMWWRGETSDVLTLERYLLDEETGEMEREQCVVSRGDLSNVLLDGRDAVARHIVAGQRVPVAAARFSRRVFVDREGLVNVFVDTQMSFATLTGSWQDDRMLCFRNAYAFPHAVVTVHIGGRVREDLPWLKKMYKLRELAYFQPDFSVVTACVACCYGDASYPLEPVETSGVEALKERGREQRAQESKSYSAEEKAARRVLFTRDEAESDPKNFWTTERTLHSWVHTAIFVALNAASLYGSSNAVTKAGGVAVAVCAILLALYAVARWLWRSRSLASERQALSAFVDRVAPIVAVSLVVFLTAVSVGARIAQ